MQVRLIVLTSLTMIAFAANSIFCRLALSDQGNDPISFTVLRLMAGAVVLLPIILWMQKEIRPHINFHSFIPALMLFSYALFFSLSYVKMTAGTGALIVFPAAQLTMLGYTVFRGVKLERMEKIGVVLALAGLVYLLLPGFDMPPTEASLMMFLSGASWGVYSLLGKNAANPFVSTSLNFIYTIPLVLILYVLYGMHLSPMGMLWAILSGSLSSALGYLLWYVVLKDLRTSTAAVALLSAPAIAAFGGIVFLGEHLSLRLGISSALILGGLYIKTMGGPRLKKDPITYR